jgi:predicted dehydrogenase
VTAERTLGVVVVGTGFGCRIHVPAARKAGLRVTALVGQDLERTARRAARAGVEQACGSLEDALRLPESDIVIVSTPPATHAELAEEAITAGRHVLVEKPFTTTVDDAERLRDLADRAGVVALVGHEFRFAPERVTLAHALHDGLAGRPRLATLIGHSALAAPLDMRAPTWWLDPARGGGWLGASVSHLVDAIRCWLGEFESVSAVLPMVSDRDPSTQAEDSVAARFTLRSGFEGVIQQSAAIWGEGFQLMRVAGPSGTLSIEGADVTFADSTGTRTLAPVASSPVTVQQSSDPRHMFTHIELGPAVVQAGILLDMAMGDRAAFHGVNAATFADGVACMRVLDAIRRSAAGSGDITPAS